MYSIIVWSRIIQFNVRNSILEVYYVYASHSIYANPIYRDGMTELNLQPLWPSYQSHKRSLIWQSLCSLSCRVRRDSYVHNLRRASCTLHTLCQTSEMMLDTAFMDYRVWRGLYTNYKLIRLAKTHLCVPCIVIMYTNYSRKTSFYSLYLAYESRPLRFYVFLCNVRSNFTSISGINNESNLM